MGTLININLFINHLVDTFFPGTDDCVDNAEVEDVVPNLEEEEFEDKEESEDRKLIKTWYLEDDVIQFEEDLIKIPELFEDIKESPTEAPHLIAESKGMQLLTSRYDDHKDKLKRKFTKS